MQIIIQLSEEDANYLNLIMRRKAEALEDYIFANLEWDAKPYCMMDYPKNVDPTVGGCCSCEYIDNCPDAKVEV